MESRDTYYYLLCSHVSPYLQPPDNLNAITQVPLFSSAQVAQSTESTLPLVSHHDVSQSRRGRPDLSQGQCSTLITARSRGTNAQPLGLHHRCHANYSHISIEIWQTEEGARAAARPESRLRAKRCADLC